MGGRVKETVVTVVFERPPSTAITSSVVEIAHAPRAAANSADDEIVRLVAADSDPAQIRVATSDRALSERVQAAGAHVYPAEQSAQRHRPRADHDPYRPLLTGRYCKMFTVAELLVRRRRSKQRSPSSRSERGTTWTTSRSSAWGCTRSAGSTRRPWRWAPTRSVAALADAGVEWKDIQFGFGGSYEVSNPDAVTRLVGLTGITFTNVFNACATAASAIQQTRRHHPAGQVRHRHRDRHGQAPARRLHRRPGASWRCRSGTPRTASSSPRSSSA